METIQLKNYTITREATGKDDLEYFRVYDIQGEFIMSLYDTRENGDNELKYWRGRDIQKTFEAKHLTDSDKDFSNWLNQ